MIVLWCTGQNSAPVLLQMGLMTIMFIVWNLFLKLIRRAAMVHPVKCSGYHM